MINTRELAQRETKEPTKPPEWTEPMTPAFFRGEHSNIGEPPEPLADTLTRRYLNRAMLRTKTKRK